MPVVGLLWVICCFLFIYLDLPPFQLPPLSPSLVSFLHSLCSFIPGLPLLTFTPPNPTHTKIGGGRSFRISGMLFGKLLFLPGRSVSKSAHSSLISVLILFQIFAALANRLWVIGMRSALLFTSVFVFLSLLCFSVHFFLQPPLTPPTSTRAILSPSRYNLFFPLSLSLSLSLSSNHSVSLFCSLPHFLFHLPFLFVM